MVYYNKTLRASLPALAAALAFAVPATAAHATDAAAAAATTATANTAAPEVETVIVTASALEDRTNRVAQGVAVMPADEAVITSLGGTLGESLAGLPGVRATFFGPNASRPVIRGLGEDRIRVLSNGLAGIDASTVSPDHAPTSDGLEATSIEVLRGPAALRYGGNAIGGVVNVVTDTIPTRPVDGTYDGSAFGGISTAEEARSYGGGLTIGTGGPLQLRVEGWSRTTDDYAIPGFVESERMRRMEGLADADAERGTVENTGGTSRALAVGLGWAGSRIEGGISVREQTSNYGIPGHEHHHEEGEEEHEEEEGGVRIDLDQVRTDARLRINDLGPFAYLNLAVTSGDYEHAEIEPDGAIGTVFSNSGWEARIEARQTAIESGIGSWTGLTGLQLGANDFAAVGAEAFVPPVAIEQAGVFTVQRVSMGAFSVEGGLRIERKDYDTATVDRSFDLASAAISVAWEASDSLLLTVALSRTDRAPTEIELFADGPHLATGSYEIGNPDLDVETGLSLEGSLRWQSGPLMLEASLWRIDFDGFATYVPTGEELDELPVYRILQGDAELTGAEIGGRFALGEGMGASWSVTADVDWVNGSYDRFGPIPRIPPLRTTLGVEADGDGVSARVWAVRTEDQDEVAGFELPTDGSTTLNARLGWKPAGDDGVLEVLLEASNITDEEVREHTSFLKDIAPRPGRSFRLALRAAF